MKNDSGTTISKPIDGVWKLIFVLVIACLSWQVQAACPFFDGFLDNKDGTVTDPRNGLIWKRCAEGSEYVSGACTIGGTELNWYDAMKRAKNSNYLGLRNWRIPSKAELDSVVCHIKGANGTWTVGTYTASQMIRNAVRAHDDYPGTFWASSPSSNILNAWQFDFGTGNISESSRTDSYRGYARLVRTGTSSGDEGTSEFNLEYSSKVLPYTSETARRKQSEEKIEAQRARGERERNVNACDRFYTGKAIGFKPAGFIYLGNVLDAVVLGKGGGNVSIKITDTNFDSYGKTFELSCTSDQLK